MTNFDNNLFHPTKFTNNNIIIFLNYNIVNPYNVKVFLVKKSSYIYLKNQ